MAKRPYTFPHRSRKEMTSYLLDHEKYHPMNSWNGGYVLAWNIKVHNLDMSGKTAPNDYPVDPRFDAAWARVTNADPDLFWEACADATQYYTDGEWTNYPGIEQGEWNFATNGRNGGWLILTDAPGWLPAPRAWKMFPMIWDSSGAFSDWLDSLDLATLRRFYRAIRVLDRDLRPEACANEVAYHVSFRRHQWEVDQVQAETDRAIQLEESRPDMYPPA